MGRERPSAGVSGGRFVVIMLALHVRQAVATVFNGVPSNARLHLIVRSLAPTVRAIRHGPTSGHASTYALLRCRQLTFCAAVSSTKRAANRAPGRCRCSGPEAEARALLL